MKVYYLHDGDNQAGPFDIDQLKSKNIGKNTPVWRDGLDEWTTAGDLQELSSIFNSATPPPLPKKYMPDQQNATNSNLSSANSSATRKSVFIPIITTVLVILSAIAAIVYIKLGGGNSSYGGESYHEKIMTVEEIEKSRPSQFLNVVGTYRKNIWGDKIIIEGRVTNNATVASYKDVEVHVVYYSQTETELSSENYVIYDYFTPRSTKTFKLKVNRVRACEKVSLKVVGAKAN